MRRAALFALVLLAPSAFADGDPESQASKQFKALVKLHLSEFKSSVKAAEKNALTSLAALDQLLPDVLVSTSAAADNVADILADYQFGLTQAVGELYDIIGNAGAEQLEALDVQVNLGNGFPSDFLAGGYGAADLLRTKLEQILDKSVARVRKRLGKTLGVVLETQGYRMTARLQTPRPTTEFASDEDGSVIFDLRSPLTIDFALAISSEANAGDAFIVAGGQATSSLGTVNIEVTGSETDLDSAAPDALKERWRAKLDDAGDLFVEQNAILAVSQGLGAQQEILAIGMP